MLRGDENKISSFTWARESANNTTLELQQDLARSTPRKCVMLTHSVPSVQMYYALRTKLDTCSESWLQEFLDLNGLDSLLDSLYQMAGYGFTCFSDAILQIDCIACIRCILNTSLGLEYFIRNDVYTKKLTMALNSADTLPKKQVFEILAAICVYSHIGYLRVLEGLSYVKSECDQMYRFSIVVSDLQSSETIAHKTAVLTFINSVINSTPDITERIRIRNEFIGLKLLDMMTYIRKEQPDEDLLLQLEVFHERKLSDEEAENTNNNLDFNSPQDLLDQIQSRVFGSPRMVNFVNILQDLLSIETTHKANSSKLWQTVEGLIHHIVHTMDAKRLDNVQSELHKLPEHLNLGLQCIYSYQQVVSQGSSCSSLQSKGSFKKSSLSYKNSLRSKSNLRQQISKGCVVGGQLGDSTRSDDVSANSSQSGNCFDGSGHQNKTVVLSRTMVGMNSTPRSSIARNSSSSQNSSANSSSKSVQFDFSGSNGVAADRTVFIQRNLDMAKNVTHSVICNNGDVSDCSNELVLCGGNRHVNVPYNESPSFHSDSYHSNQLNYTASIHSSQSNGSHDETYSLGIRNKSYGRNYNIQVQKEKAYNYNQNKVASQLEMSGCDSASSKNSSGFDDSAYDNLPVRDSGLYTREDLQQFESNQDSFKKNNIESVPDVPVIPKTSSPCEQLFVEVNSAVKEQHKIARQLVPIPKKPMYEFKWITLDDDKIVGREPCVWLPPMSGVDGLHVDYTRLEAAFQSDIGKNTQAIEEVVLLNASTRLNITLFLSRLDAGAEDLVQNLEEGNMKQLNLAMLQYLSNIIPCPEEIEMLRAYKGPRLELGMAEQFVLLLSDIPDYAVLLEGQLMRAEFDATITEFKDSLTSLVAMANLILTNTELKHLLHVILGVGNFINHGMYNGDAAGFKLSSLLRLQEVKSRSPSKSLLHHLVQNVSEDHEKLLGFVKQLLPLEKAASCSFEEMKANISKLNGKLRYFVNNLTRAGHKIQAMFSPFIETLKKEFCYIQTLTTELRGLTDQLAEYFCEDEATFNLQECMQCLLTFCHDIQKCQNDNSSLNRQHQLARKKGDVLHRRLKSKLLSLEFGENAAASSSMMEDKPKVLEKMLHQLHRGNFNPSVKSEVVTPDDDPHPLEMSCIPYTESPYARNRLGTASSDNVFETPEITCVESDRTLQLTRSSTQRIHVVTTCTAQTKRPSNILSKQDNNLPTRDSIPSSPVRAGSFGSRNGEKIMNVNPHRKLFPLADAENGKNDLDKKDTGRTAKQLELPRRKATHRRSRSDLADSMCIVNKWIEYEKLRSIDGQDGKQAPIAEPESVCNLSTLNLENNGKFITNEDVAEHRRPARPLQERNLQNGPVVLIPDDKGKKKKTVGSFFSKLGRAVLKPRNVYSEGDQPDYTHRASMRKKSFSNDKENIAVETESLENGLPGRDKRLKSESKMSRFFQRGGLYRSSKMKSKKYTVQ